MAPKPCFRSFVNESFQDGIELTGVDFQITINVSGASHFNNEKYQEFPWGYGIMFDEESRRFWAMGWSVHIPGFSKAVSGNLEGMLRVFRLEQLAHFEAARRHPWIKANLEHLEEFKTADGTYLFPRDYLPEKPAAYWVMGGKMAMEDNPRNKKALEIESTFRMAKIKKSFGAELN
jgi:hypothetical protein